MQTRPSHTHSHCDVQVGICLVRTTRGHPDLGMHSCSHGHTHTLTPCRGVDSDRAVHGVCAHTEGPHRLVAASSRLNTSGRLQTPSCVCVWPWHHDSCSTFRAGFDSLIWVWGHRVRGEGALGLWEEGLGTWTPGSEGVFWVLEAPLTSLAY